MSGGPKVRSMSLVPRISVLQEKCELLRSASSPHLTYPHSLIVLFPVVFTYLFILLFHQPLHLPIAPPFKIPLRHPIEPLFRGEFRPHHVEISRPCAGISLSTAAPWFRRILIRRAAKARVRHRIVGVQGLIGGQKGKQSAIDGEEALA